MKLSLASLSPRIPPTSQRQRHLRRKQPAAQS